MYVFPGHDVGHLYGEKRLEDIVQAYLRWCRPPGHSASVVGATSDELDHVIDSLDT